MMLIEKKVESYLEKSNVLFSEWKNKELHRNALFIEDGVVNPEIYFGSSARIMFLLKEAYSKDQDDRPLTDWLNDEGVKISTIWRRVSEWTRMIHSYLDENVKDVSFKSSSDFKSNGNDFLRSIAVVNVKKSNGNSTSEYQELKEYTSKDKEELFEQLRLCDPTVIVCGNVRGCLSEIIKESGEVLTKVNEDHYVYRFKLNGHDVLVIDYWHPANRYPNLMNYYGFANVCKVAFGEK